MPYAPDWRSRLGALISASRTSPHAWGQHDCALWGADCREAVTGEATEEASLRGSYSTALGAARALKSLGFDSLEGLLDARLGARKPPAFARAGDLVMADLQRLGIGTEEDAFLGLTVGVCYGRSCYFVGADGLVAVPTLSVEHCYHG